MTTELPPLIPAATVIIVRDGTDALEVLLLKRSAVGAFPGMWVFPGGRVDATDHGDNEFEQAQHAAAREAHEEVGLVVPADSLVTWAHWTPPPQQPKRFNTWFFVATWTGQPVVIDEHEIVDHVWLEPATALQQGLPIAPPTFVTLHQLADFTGVDELAGGPRRGVERFATKHAVDGDDTYLLWHGDSGYELGDHSLAGDRHRARMTKGRIRSYDRTA